MSTKVGPKIHNYSFHYIHPLDERPRTITAKETKVQHPSDFFFTLHTYGTNGRINLLNAIFSRKRVQFTFWNLPFSLTLLLAFVYRMNGHLVKYKMKRFHILGPEPNFVHHVTTNSLYNLH